VRFKELNKAIFLQIQVGKLLPMAMIDEKTVQWQDLPRDNNENNFFIFNYDNRKLQVNSNLKFLDSVVTGNILNFYVKKRKNEG
jgi:hypothetical protein